MKSLVFFLVCFFLSYSELLAQNLNTATIDTIYIKGNFKTNHKIILRELKFKQNDTILLSELADVIEESRLLVISTGLFTNVNISFKNWNASDNRIQLLVEVAENWYLYPAPIFELADRNFNVWWVDYKRSLQRVNVGGEFVHLNFTGNKDRLKIGAKFGYSRNFILSYRLPYINKNQTLGFSTYLSYSMSREVNYITQGNKQLFFRDEDNFVDIRFKSEFALQFRPKLRIFHDFIFSFNQDRISEAIFKELNPNFFSNKAGIQRFFTIAYKFTSEQTDIKAYPLLGYRIIAELEKNGLGIFDDRNALTTNLAFSKFLTFSEKWYFNFKVKGKYSLIRQQQSYKYNRGLGFSGDYLRGYEFYIIDGLDMAYLRTSFKFKLIDEKFNLGKIVPIKAFRILPTKIFLSLNNDTGYVNGGPLDKIENPLTNKWLWAGGIGLDFVILYDKVFQIQYSFNDLLENGLFLHLDLNF